MLRAKLIWITFSSCLIFITCDCNVDCPDYYWRDFTGNIPRDAFVGAKRNEDSLYVGQVFFRQYNLLPATIYPNGLAYTTAYNKFLKTNQYVKILASPNNDLFEWIPIRSEHLHQHLSEAVPGGSEVGQTIYIGRAKHGSEYMIGKVFKHDQRNRGLWLQKERGRHANFLTYDLLVYNCSKVKAVEEKEESTPGASADIEHVSNTPRKIPHQLRKVKIIRLL